MPLSTFQLLILSMGGSDGGIKQTSADGSVTDLSCHLLQVTADTAFTALVGVNASDVEVNMVTANGLDSVTAPAVIGAPDLHKGGYIKTVQLASGELLRHTLPNTQRGV
jgi:hypothetical protein